MHNFSNFFSSLRPLSFRCFFVTLIFFNRTFFVGFIFDFSFLYLFFVFDLFISVLVFFLYLTFLFLYLFFLYLTFLFLYLFFFVFDLFISVHVFLYLTFLFLSLFYCYFWPWFWEHKFCDFFYFPRKMSYFFHLKTSCICYFYRNRWKTFLKWVD